MAKRKGLETDRRLVRRMRTHDQIRVNGGLHVFVFGQWRQVVKIVRDAKHRQWHWVLGESK